MARFGLAVKEEPFPPLRGERGCARAGGVKQKVMRDDFAAVAADLVRRGVTRPGGHYPPIPVVEPTHARETLSRLSVSTILDAPSRSCLRPRSCSRDAASLLLSLEEWIDTNSAAGELVFHVFGAIAHFERRLIAERTRGRGRRRSSSWHTPRAPPSRSREEPQGFPLAPPARTPRVCAPRCCAPSLHGGS
jgi:Resolvase, N terminal domain